jgi:NAD(P)H-flavin reductase
MQPAFSYWMCMAPVESDPMLPQPFIVRRVFKETSDTFTLALDSSREERLAFQPGQFSMLWVFGVGELPISISGDPTDTASLTYTVRSVGPATHALVSRSPGQSLGVRGPFGAGWPLEAAKHRDILVVAGGIGLAPLRPVIYHVLRHRSQYGKLIVLYGARSPQDMLYRKELAAWARQPDTQVMSTVDYGGVGWRGRVGVVTSLLRFVRLHPPRTTTMVCGPEIMMRFVSRELLAKGMAAEDVYLSIERNMKCAVGFCGHCQWGPHFICKDGPVFPYSRITPLLDRYEL